MLDLKTIKYLLTILDRKNLSRAADDLHLTQSALTKRIHQLEEQLDVQLLSRQSHGVEPTFYGDIVGKHAQKIQTYVEDMQRELSAAKEGRLGILNLGVGVRWQNNHLIGVIAALLKESHGLHIKITGGLHNNLMELLRKGEVDMVLGSFVTDDPRGNVVSLPMFTTRICVVARKKHPLARKKPTDLAQLLEYSWILPYPHYPTRTQLYSIFSEHNLPPPEPDVETESTILTFSLLRAANFLTLASDCRLQLLDNKDLSIIEFPEDVPEIRCAINHLKDRELSPAATVFKRELEGMFDRQ